MRKQTMKKKNAAVTAVAIVVAVLVVVAVLALAIHLLRPSTAHASKSTTSTVTEQNTGDNSGLHSSDGDDTPSNYSSSGGDNSSGSNYSSSGGDDYTPPIHSSGN